ncbi:MAG: helix-turn-helix domain-containing protein [Clostridia bacterium]|nr:helix-turn-helix domain-containing protein [Clostridia bacterium]
MDVNKLRGKIVEKGMNVDRLAETLEIDRSSLYRKLNKFERLTIGEASRLKDILGLTNEEATDIFLA